LIISEYGFKKNYIANNFMNMLNNFPPSAKVWVYQSSRALSDEEVITVQAALNSFAQQWTSHNLQLRAAGEVLYKRFILLAVDESQAGASGCSIDKSVAFIKTLQAALGTDLFDRMRFAYLNGDQVCSVSRDEFANLYANGTINSSTLVFDPLVDTVGKLQEAFIKPLDQSWHIRMV
jgi:hypothetical protein